MSKLLSAILIIGCFVGAFVSQHSADAQTQTTQQRVNRTRSLPESTIIVAEGDQQKVTNNRWNQDYLLEGPNSDELVEPPIMESDAGLLTLTDLEIIALQYNPSLASMLDEIEALQSLAHQAGLCPNPTVGYVGNEIGNENSVGQHGAFISRQHVRGGKIKYSRQVALAEVDVKRQQLRQQEMRVITDLRLAYVNYAVALKRVEISTSLVSTNQELVATTQKLIDAREAKQSDLLLVEIELQKSQTTLYQAENALEGVNFRLAAICGQHELNLAALGPDALKEETEVNFEETLNQLLGGSPEVGKAETEIRRAESKINRECAETVSDIESQLSVQHDTATNDFFANVQVSFPLQVNNRNQGNIAAARHELSAARHRANQVRLRLTNMFALEFQNYQLAQIETEQYTDEILPRAEQTLELVGRGYRLGEIGFTDFITAQRTYVQATLQQLNAVEMLWQSRTKLEGMLLSGSME